MPPTVSPSSTPPDRSTVMIVAQNGPEIDDLVDELGMHFAIERRTTGSAALEAAAQHTPDAIFLDHEVPDAHGTDFLDALRAAGCTTPVIILTSPADLRSAATALRSGASDFAVKGTDDVLCEQLIPLTIRAIEKWHNERELDYLRHQAEDQTRHTQRLNDALRRKNDQLVAACAQIESSHHKLHRKNARLSELYDTAHRFVDNVSHEMRTPLTVINEFIAILVDGLAGPLNDQQREYLEIAATKTADLTRMVDDMLDLSKLEAGLLRVDRTRTTLPAIMADITDALTHKARIHHVTLEQAIPVDLPDVYCDGDKIARVLMNLVINAMKFSPEGSAVRVWAQTGAQSDELTIGVTDQGRGIAPEHLQLIFERFQQVGSGTRASTRGFGLGLNIVRELVHLSLGDVTVDSTIGTGSTFAFTVPVYERSAIMRRYLERLALTVGPGRALACIRARSEHGGPDIAAHIREHLAHNTRPFDLLFDRRSSGDVILVSATDDAEDLAHRLAVRNREDMRLSPGSTVQLSFDVVQHWPSDVEDHDIVSSFEAQFVDGETADA